MASQTLVTAAEKMYGSMADLPEGSVGVGRLLLDPATTALKENIAAQKKITDDLMGKMPMGVDILKVDEKLRPMITEFTAVQKEKYIQAAEVVASGISSKDPRYIKAVEEMNQVKTAFENLDANLTGLGENIKFAFENRDQLAGGLSGQWQEFDMELFANKGIYDKILEHGIGEDGSLSYTSGELSNPNKEKIQTLKAKLEGIEDKTSTEAININNEIAGLEATGRVGVVKKTSDYGGHAIHNTGAVDVINNLRDTIVKAATSGAKWDENSIDVTVDKIINQLGPDGVRDVMFKYESYINGYIENKFGFKKGTVEFDAKKDELATEDLTEEFKEHFLGAEDNPGMLRNAYKENYIRPKRDTPTPTPTVHTYKSAITVPYKGGQASSYTFKYEATTQGRMNSLQLVEDVLNNKPTVIDNNSKDPITGGGVVYTWDDAEKVYVGPEYKTEGGDVIEGKEYTGGWDGTLIQQFGGVMQPQPIWEPEPPKSGDLKLPAPLVGRKSGVEGRYYQGFKDQSTEKRKKSKLYIFKDGDFREVGPDGKIIKES